MRLGDGEDSDVEVQWYFVPEGRCDLGIWTPFCSRNWDQNEGTFPDVGLGERPGEPRPWRNGSQKATCYSGRGRCGTVEQWEKGIGAERPEAPPLADDQCPGCCDPGYGLWIGGGSVPRWPSGIELGGGLRPVQTGGILVGGGSNLFSTLTTGLGGGALRTFPGGFGGPAGGAFRVVGGGPPLGGGHLRTPAAPFGGGVELGGGAAERDQLLGGGVELGGGAAERDQVLGGGVVLGGGYLLPAGNTVVRRQVTRGSTGGTSLTLTFPTATLDGSFLVIFVTAVSPSGGPPTISTPAGLTLVNVATRLTVRCNCYCKVNSAPLTALGPFPRTGTSGGMCGIAIEYRNVKAITPVDRTATSQGGTAAVSVNTLVATSQPLEVAVAGFGYDKVTAAPTVDGLGYVLADFLSEIFQGSSLGVWDKLTTAVGTHPCNIVIPIVANSANVIVTARTP